MVGSPYFSLFSNTRPDRVVHNCFSFVVSYLIPNASCDNCSSISGMESTSKAGKSYSGTIISLLTGFGNGITMQSLMYSDGNV